MRLMGSFIAACVASVLAAGPAAAEEDALETLVSWMSGSFSSEAQAEADSAYYVIRLEIAPLWTHLDAARWLYVEQAVAGNTDAPYRQRVYRVSQEEDGIFKSEVYLLPDEDAAVGAWRHEEPMSDLTPADLELREGCAVFLRRDVSGEFTGGTKGSGCASELRGATYATSEVVVGPDGLESWDRGFDADGAQVWGAEKGAYVFLRTDERPTDALRALPDELRATIDAFYASVEAGDVEARIDLFGDDVILMPNHWTMSRGKESVAAIFRGSADAVFRLRDREIVRADVSGDMAYTVNSYFYTYHNQGDEPQWHKTKNVHIWRRDDSGNWKLAVDIWNSDVPMAAFGEE